MNNYIITTKKGINISVVENDLTRNTTTDATVNSSIVPDRAVSIPSPIKASERNTFFTLSKTEANNLRNDNRVEHIQKIPFNSTFPLVVTESLANFNDVRACVGFNPQSTPSATNTAFYWMTKNEDLSVLTHPELQWSGSANRVPGSKGNTLTGEGVDLIVIDMGFTPYHQEYLRDPNKPVLNSSDPENRSRVNFLKWYEHLSIDEIDPPNHNSEFLTAYHGQNCMSIATGNVFGWAPKAEIFFLKVSPSGLAGSNAYSSFEVYSLVKRFHESKSIDTNTGYKRPTVVSNSTTMVDRFYVGSFEAAGGTSNTDVDVLAPTGIDQGFIFNPDGIAGPSNQLVSSAPDLSASLSTGFPTANLTEFILNSTLHNKWVPSVNADADAASDAGVIICHAAGNRSMPTAGSGSTDPEAPDFDKFFNPNYYSSVWESYYTFAVDNSNYDAGEKVFYHRSGPPGGNSIVKVANISWKTFYNLTSNYANNNERIRMRYGLAPSSERGPRVDIGALSQTSTAGAPSDPSIGPHSPPYPDLSPPSGSIHTHTSYIITSSIYGETDPEIINQINLGQLPGVKLNLNRRNVTNTRRGGTSYSAPNIAGMACLWCELEPNGNAIGFKKFLSDNANTNTIEAWNHPELSLNDPPPPTDPTHESLVYIENNYYNKPPPNSYTDFFMNSAQYRPLDNRIKLANWPYNDSIPVNYLGPIKITHD